MDLDTPVLQHFRTHEIYQGLLPWYIQATIQNSTEEIFEEVGEAFKNYLADCFHPPPTPLAENHFAKNP